MKEPTSARLSGAERFINVLFALVIIAFGVLGLYKGDLLLPGKRTSGPNGIALHGVSARLMYSAMVCAVYVLLAPVIGHHAASGSDAPYLRFAKVAKVCGWALFAVALAVYAFGK